MSLIDKTYSDQEYKDAKVSAPIEFWDKPNSLRTGGCGAGKFGDLLVPDTLWGLPVTGICQIHDHQYGVGKTEEDRAEADRTLRNNLFRWIEYQHCCWFLAFLRRRRAVTYYAAVRMFGGPAFWNSKNG